MDSLLNFAAGQLQNQMSGQNHGNNNGQQQQYNNNQNQQQFQNNNNQNYQNNNNNNNNYQGQQQQNQNQGGFQAEQSSGLNFGALLAGANQQHGNGDALSGLIQNAMGHVQNNVSPNAQVSEQQVQENHDQAYNQGNASNMTASAMGSAAAIQAFKSFASGGGQQQGGGSLISKLIGMAMSEAAKLFDKSGGAASGNKQDVLNSAGETMMKLMVQNQISGALSGGSSGGGQATQLLGLASKFLS